VTDTLNPPTTGHDDLDAMIAGLIDLAAWRDRHDLALTTITPIFIVSRRNGMTATDAVRALTDGARIGEVDKKVGGDETIMFVERHFAGGVRLSYQAQRDEVCTRRVVGTETVEVPDPAAPKVTVEREIVEWDCEPILASSGGGS
jgi:hypothetical protein